MDLQWTTASEQQTDRFVIQRSSDGKNYTPIDYVPAAGFSVKPNSYRYTDNQPMTGRNYYRIMLVNSDQSTENGPVCVTEVVTTPVAQIGIKPNPVSNMLTVELPESDQVTYKYQVISTMGTILLSGNSNGETRTNRSFGINTEKLLPGSYVLKLSTADSQNSATFKFIKTN